MAGSAQLFLRREEELPQYRKGPIVVVDPDDVTRMYGHSLAPFTSTFIGAAPSGPPLAGHPG
jgi:hypothetical protein